MLRAIQIVVVVVDSKNKKKGTIKKKRKKMMIITLAAVTRHVVAENWYALSIVLTFIIGIGTLWIKSGVGTKKITKKLIEIDTNNMLEHKDLNKAIKLNTDVTKEVANRRDVYAKLEAIKTEAIRWSPKAINNFVVLKANAMSDFFIKIEKRKFAEVDMDTINAEIEIAISKLKTDARELISTEFVDYYFNSSHNDNIQTYLDDLSVYKKGKLNNMNEAFLSRSVVFYRHSLEDLLNLWTQYKLEKKEKKNEKKRIN